MFDILEQYVSEARHSSSTGAWGADFEVLWDAGVPEGIGVESMYLQARLGEDSERRVVIHCTHSVDYAREVRRTTGFTAGVAQFCCCFFQSVSYVPEAAVTEGSDPVEDKVHVILYVMLAVLGEVDYFVIGVYPEKALLLQCHLFQFLSILVSAPSL